MKLTLTILLFSVAQLASAAGVITTARDGDAKVKQQSEYATLIEIPLKTISASEDIPSKYIILSNGQVLEPSIQGNCRAYQVFQSAFYMRQVSSVTIAVENQPGKSCAEEVQKIMNAPKIKVNFTTALLGDGTGADIAPILLEVTK